MNTTFINSENSKTSDPYRPLLNLTGKINFKRNDKYVSLSNLSIHHTWENIKIWYKNNKFKISACTWNDKFEWSDRSYSLSDIQNYFENIIKKHETVTDNTSIRIYVHKIEIDSHLKLKQGIISNF